MDSDWKVVAVVTVNRPFEPALLCDILLFALR